jgi:hypothetical protein
MGKGLERMVIELEATATWSAVFSQACVSFVFFLFFRAAMQVQSVWNKCLFGGQV